MLTKLQSVLKLTISVVFFLLCPVSMAVQGQEGYFVGAHAGAAFSGEDSDLLQDGYSVGLQYGYRLRHFRTALALNYINHEFESPDDGNYDFINLMTNFYYDFNYQGTFVPFFGVGVGYLNASKDNCNAFSDCSDLETGSQFAYQGLLGLGMQKDNLRFDLQYRYLSYTGNKGFFDNVVEAVFSFFL